MSTDVTILRALRSAALALGLGIAALSPASAADPPWVQAQSVLDASMMDLKSGGIRALKDHVPAIEQALAGGKAAIAAAAAAGFELADGTQEMLVVMGSLKPPRGVEVSAMDNPYPALALYLGSYYNDIGKPDDALRVLDLGLTLFVVDGIHIGAHWPGLMFERGAALVGLKRWTDVLSAYDDVLKEIPDMQPAMQARFDRGRGFALTELGRLDDAEAAYRESLELEPGNARALAELDYIAKLRAGGPAAPTGIVPVQPQGAPENKSGQ